MNTSSCLNQSKLKLALCLALLMLVSTGCSHVSMGSMGAKTTATGAAAGEHAEGVNPDLQRCASPVGTMAVNEDYSASWLGQLRGYGIQSTVPVLRLLAQQSNCFVVVERGRGMNNMMEERALAQSGELRKGSNFGKGQMVAADYTIVPTLIFEAANTGGVGGLVSHFLPSSISAFSSLALNVDVKDAQSQLALVDNRSGVQVGIAEGSGRAYDMGGIMNLFGILGGKTSTGLDAYQRTPQGKVVVASLTDAFNNLISVVRQYRPQKAAGPGGHGTGGKLKVN